MKFDLTHAKHDPAHCLAPGLFRSFQRGERKKSKERLDITYQYGTDSIRFWGPEPLGADDLRVLQGLVAMAGPDGLILSPEPKTEGGRQLRAFLEPKWEAIHQNGLVIKGSFRQLALEIGYAENGGSQLKTIRESIERLWAISVIVERNSKRRGFRILSEYNSDEKEGQLFVALNPQLAEAVMGDRPHSRINMNEIRSLKTDPARLIHQRLCGWIDPKKSGRVELDTLCSYVWPEETNPNAMKRRRQIAKKTLEEIRSLKWKIEEYASNKWLITRP